MTRAALLASAVGWALTPAIGFAQQTPITDFATQIHIFDPAKLEPSAERIRNLKPPKDFKVDIFARDLINPRMLAVSADGTVYATRRSVGDVIMLKDDDSDGRADRVETVATRPGMHGIAIDGDTMYLTTVTDVYRAEIRDDGTIGSLEPIIDDLPDGGQHPNRTLAMGPDGGLYISVGSSCNACAETNPEHATLLRAKPDGSSRTIFASGLRNLIGFAWHPETGALWGMDHNIDNFGDDKPLEELNLVEQGKNYGWPYVYGDGEVSPHPRPPNGLSPEVLVERSQNPTLGYTAHAAPMQMAFTRGSRFPPDYRDDAFVAMRGSWNRKPAVGYEVVRVRFENGRPQGIEPFLTGFLSRENGAAAHFGRPTGLAFTPDGAMLVADDTNGIIYRVSYEGQAVAGNRAGGLQEQEEATGAVDPLPPAQRRSSELASRMDDLSAETDLRVTSPAFTANEAVPERFSADGENISPPLAWDGAPEETKAFVILMEDPDADEPKPSAHWVVYDIPADVEELAEGLPTEMRLVKPEGLLQGRNSRGSTGYSGPNPPEEDQPHEYHIQVFALDAPLGLDPGASRDDVIEAMKGHVLAKGELVGTFDQQPATGAVPPR